MRAVAGKVVTIEKKHGGARIVNWAKEQKLDLRETASVCVQSASNTMDYVW